MDDKTVQLHIIEDKYDRFLANYALDFSDFLTLEEQSMAMRFVNSHRKEGVFFYGGYEDAERKMVAFVPDYLEIRTEEELDEYLRGNPDDSPISVLEVSVPSQEKVTLGHRDYLGALMGEGIKREKVGDIIVGKSGAQLLVKKEMGEYLLQNYRQIGRASVNTGLKELSSLETSEIRKEEAEYNVSSPRLDNVVSAVFHISRKDAVEAISRGIVFVNGMEAVKPGYTMKEGEKLVLRGKGKAIYLGITGESRKGKFYIKVEKYI